jgi:hypothetical protein
MTRAIELNIVVAAEQNHCAQLWRWMLDERAPAPVFSDPPVRAGSSGTKDTVG